MRKPGEQSASAFLNDEVPNSEDALAGARDIVAEMISDNPEVRRVTREKALKFANMGTSKVEDAADEKSVYKLYYDFSFRIDKIRPHQILAVNRGERRRFSKSRSTFPNGLA